MQVIIKQYQWYFIELKSRQDSVSLVDSYLASPSLSTGNDVELMEFSREFHDASILAVSDFEFRLVIYMSICTQNF